MRPLDDLDRRLLAALRANGRESVAALARDLGVTRSTINARLDRLISSNTIVGFSVKIREGQNPDTIRAIALIEVEGRTTDAVIGQLRGLIGVESLHTTNGGWDLVAELRTDTLANFDLLLRDIRSIEGIVNSETSLLLSSVLS